jgi:hypothetical protein
VTGAGDEVDGEETVRGDGALEVMEEGWVEGEGAEHIGFTGQIAVIDDDVELLAVMREPVTGVVEVEFEAEGIEVHEPAGEADDYGVDFDGGELGLGEQVAEDAEGGSAGESEHEDATWGEFGVEQGCGSHRAPGEGEEPVAVPPGMQSALDLELALVRVAANDDDLMGGMRPGEDSHVGRVAILRRGWKQNPLPGLRGVHGMRGPGWRTF